MSHLHGLRRAGFVVLLLTLWLLFSGQAGLAMPALFTDPLDGKFDASKFLLERHGVLPVPILITEPAIGYGGGAALVYFHRKKGEAVEDLNFESLKEPMHLPRPSTTAVFGLGTENGTWTGGVAHRGIWMDDQIRYLGTFSKLNINIDFYRKGRAIGANLDSVLLMQEIQFRIGATGLFLGADYIYFDTDASLDWDRKIGDWLPDSLGESTVAGVGAILHYDNTDNLFSPTRGQNVELVLRGYGSAVGGDDSFERLEWDAQTFHPLGEKFNLGIQLKGASVWGDAPFFVLPYIELRGVPIMRYQGQTAGALEMELQWKATPRWNLVGFVGVGRADAGDRRTTSESGIFAGGAGFRYLLVRALGMQVGVDIARGPEDTAFYIQVGNAW